MCMYIHTLTKCTACVLPHIVRRVISEINSTEYALTDICLVLLLLVAFPLVDSGLRFTFLAVWQRSLF